MCLYKCLVASVRTVFILLTFMMPWSLFAQQSDSVMDIYESGAAVQILTDTQGDVVVAGGSVSIIRPVLGDVLAGGGTINISTDVSDDVRAAGGSVAIVGNIGDDLIAAGGKVTIDASSHIGGRAWLVGRVIQMAGHVTGEMRAKGQKIVLSGTVDGDVDLLADSIEIRPDAVIKGKLTYASPRDAVVGDGAVIEGEVSQSKFEIHHKPEEESKSSGILGYLMYYLSLTASAIILFLIFPLRSVMATQQLGDTPFKAAGVGLVILLATPIAALMLMVSVLGMPLGFVLLGLYLATLIIGLLTGVIWIGDAVFRRLGKQPDQSKQLRLISIAVGAVVLMIVDLIPFIGGLIFFIVLLLGIGGLILFLFERYQNRDEQPTSGI